MDFVEIGEDLYLVFMTARGVVALKKVEENVRFCDDKEVFWYTVRIGDSRQVNITTELENWLFRKTFSPGPLTTVTTEELMAKWETQRGWG